ncbi:ABC transporter ATP-binding protein [Pseudonocardia sp. GCM10023141]|uniref:ABC transporter ATP-binding protein n=1 Tax=Pseudonocardia sp. GCM10023141 TaxID=3252653 RepID=UPI003615B2EC
MTLLTVRGLTAGYGEGEVIHDVDLAVAPGATTALLGANGAGKTTTLRAITGMIARRGTVTFDGHDLAGLTSDQVARLGIAHVPQGRGTFAQLSVQDNLLVGALSRRDRSGVATDLDRCRSLFPILATRARSAAGTLSGGEQQMLAMSRALMARPRLLVLDEPSLGLAPGITRQIFDLLPLLRVEWDTAVLVVEQNANLALALADDAVVLENGRVAMAGAAAEIAGHDDVRRAYLGT